MIAGFFSTCQAKSVLATTGKDLSPDNQTAGEVLELPSFVAEAVGCT